jgi:hypothetical protein
VPKSKVRAATGTRGAARRDVAVRGYRAVTLHPPVALPDRNRRESIGMEADRESAIEMISIDRYRSEEKSAGYLKSGFSGRQKRLRALECARGFGR